MKVVLYGATGIVGQAVLRACLLDPEVATVVAVGGSATGRQDPKLREVVVPDVTDTSTVAAEFADADACFFCLGVSAAGLDEARYTEITYDLTLAVATAAATAHPGMTFGYVSGAGTDSTGKGRAMWARVKGRTENAIFALPLDGYAFRPGFVQPVNGETSRTRWYRLVYRIMGPLAPLLRRVAPNSVITSAELGRAMLRAAHDGSDQRVLDSRTLTSLGRA